MKFTLNQPHHSLNHNDYFYLNSYIYCRKTFHTWRKIVLPFVISHAIVHSWEYIHIRQTNITEEFEYVLYNIKKEEVRRWWFLFSSYTCSSWVTLKYENSHTFKLPHKKFGSSPPKMSRNAHHKYNMYLKRSKHKCAYRLCFGSATIVFTNDIL